MPNGRSETKYLRCTVKALPVVCDMVRMYDNVSQQWGGGWTSSRVVDVNVTVNTRLCSVRSNSPSRYRRCLVPINKAGHNDQIAKVDNVDTRGRGIAQLPPGGHDFPGALVHDDLTGRQVGIVR